MGDYKPIHLSGLNGLRAFAALAVVVSHSRLAQDKFGLPPTTSLQLAQYGVTIFFALSGFLITFLLLKEREQTQTVNIQSFYIRRVLRIWPLYYFYLLVSVSTLWFTQREVLPGSLLYYLFMLANVPFIINRALPKVDHYWSLGVEEQFYLVWPLIMRHLRNPFTFLIGVISLFIVGRGIAGYLKFKYQIEIPYLIFTVNRFDCMALGCLGAFVIHENRQRVIQMAHSLAAQVIVWATFALITFNQFKIHPLVNHIFVAGITVLAILNLAFNRSSIVSFDYPIIDFLGKISFGIYVYHPLVIFAAAKAKHYFLPEANLGLWIFPIIVGATILVSYLSYQFFEKRFLKIKDRYAIVRSSGSKDLI